ncbi:MAG: G-D-S-L family lipolytic protein [Actinobacteria bacterium]|nr:G-D-S-L family lipolytic protein [Actinomycetota bacterium]
MIDVVYFFGDSFVAGFGDPTGHGWIGRVQESAPPEMRFTAVNRGVPGATSIQCVRDWQDAAERLLADDVSGSGVVFSFGTNDVISVMPPGQTCEALGEALSLAAAIGMPALVVGPPPIGDMPREERLLASLAGDLALICATHGAFYVDAHDELLASPVWMSEIACGDGSHPQADGYETLAKLVIDAGFFDWLAGRDPATVG